MKIAELLDYFGKRLEQIDPSAFYVSCGNTTKGTKVVMGRHLNVYVLASRWKPYMRKQILTLIEMRYASVKKAHRPCCTHLGGGSSDEDRVFMSMGVEY